jgi:hypothetical protein
MRPIAIILAFVFTEKGASWSAKKLLKKKVIEIVETEHAVEAPTQEKT